MEAIREPKVPLPERFNGNRRNFRPFMSQVESNFKLNQSRFSTDSNKILFIGSLLTGDAGVWFDAMNRVSENEMMTSYEYFIGHFTILFSDPTSAATTRRQIKQLYQGNLSASTYAMKFTSLSMETGFNDAALLDTFQSNLNNEIKDILASSVNVPQTFPEFVNYVIGIDNRLFERRMELSSRRGVTKNLHALPIQQTYAP